jgi:DNA-binding SARP family transcriptional activator
METRPTVCPLSVSGHPHISFTVLGPLTVRHGGADVAIPPGKPRALLVALLLRAGEVVSVSRLTDVLWDTRPPATALAALHNHVMRLRRQLGDCPGSRIKTLSPGYLIEVEPGELDLQQFLALRASGRSAGQRGAWADAAGDLRAAMDLFDAGPPVAGADVPALRQTEVPALAEMGVQTLEWRIEADLHLGRHEELIAELKRLCDVHPARERLHEQMMLALFRSGRRAEALGAYQEARRWLVAELGIEPSSELQSLHQRVLASDASLLDTAALSAVGGRAAGGRAAGGQAAGGQAAGGQAAAGRAAAPAQPAQLPADLADFTGRASETAELAGWLAPAASGEHGPTRVCGITGAGGMGKTALAVHVAHQVSRWFPDGQLHAELRGTRAHPASAADVLTRFLHQLGVSEQDVPSSTEERGAAYRSLLSGKRMLVLLDDAQDAAHVRPLLPGTGGCGVLVTSRGRLADLDGASILELTSLDNADAWSLLSHVCGPSRLSAEPDAGRDVLRACAGLPIAIRIAAARLASRPRWSVRYVADLLADEQNRLDELASGDRAVRASFTVSYTSLRPSADGDAPDLARAFRTLGLWDGPSLSLAGAAAMLKQPLPVTGRTVERLVDAHLVESAGDARYRFHDLLRLYAGERAAAQDPPGARTGAVRRLLTWYLHSTVAAIRALTPRRSHLPTVRASRSCEPVTFGSTASAMDWLETERANLVTATRQAADHGLHSIAWLLPVYLATFFDLRCYNAEWSTTHEVGLASARQAGDRQGEAWMLGSLGFALVQAERCHEAIAHLGRAVELHREVGCRRGEANALNTLGSAYGLLNDFDACVSHLNQALAIRRHIGDLHGRSMTQSNLAMAHYMLAEPGTALHHAERGVRVAKQTGDLRLQGNALGVLGNVLRVAGRVDEAIEALREAVAIEHETGNQRYEAGTQDYLARALADSGRVAEARAAWTAALALAQPRQDALADRIRKELEMLH